ncbi:hypothetical protein oki361_23270 [Helicobacter pylori]
MMNINNYALNKELEVIQNNDDKTKLSEQFHNKFSIFNFFPLRKEAEKLKNELKNVLILESKCSNLLEKFNDIIQFMKKGRRGTFFNQLNIIYFSGLAYFAKYNANNNLIILFKKYFRELISKINIALDEVLGEFYCDLNGKKINLLEKYNLDKYTLDIDVNNDFFISYLTDNDNIVNAISTIYAASASAINSSSCLPFEDSVLIKKGYSIDLYKKFNQLYDTYALKSTKLSNYIFDHEKGMYKLNEINMKHRKEASDALQYYTYLSAESMNNYLRNDFIDKLKNIDYTNLVNNEKLINNYESSFDFYKNSLLEYFKNDNEEKNKVELLRFEKKSDREKLANKTLKIDKKNFNKLINTRTLTSHKLKVDFLMNEKNKEKLSNDIKVAVKSMGGVIQTAASISQLYFATQSNDINKTLNITKSIHGIVSGTLNIFSMFPIVSVISGIVDILFSIITQIIGSKTQFDYIYSQTGNPNVQYI